MALNARALPYEELSFATLDHHRGLRTGFPEVVYCEGKTPEHAAEIIAWLADRGPRPLATRATPIHYAAARQRGPDSQIGAARRIWRDGEPEQPRQEGVVRERPARATCRCSRRRQSRWTMGHQPQRIVDVGVAGLHRLLRHIPAIQAANVVVVFAGMEGALASVVGGLTDAPVIAVPTSVGYGASFGGLAALLAMLNSCASGVAVVNIDNGFGAGHMAALINNRIVTHQGDCGQE